MYLGNLSEEVVRIRMEKIQALLQYKVGFIQILWLDDHSQQSHRAFLETGPMTP